MTERGLREIKKEATARALAESAFELALERGMDGFVIADVTQRAGYARRTFANHFSCKEEAVTSVLFAGADTSVAAFIASLPEGTSLLDAFHELLRSQMSAEMFDRVHRLTLALPTVSRPGAAHPRRGETACDRRRWKRGASSPKDATPTSTFSCYSPRSTGPSRCFSMGASTSCPRDGRAAAESGAVTFDEFLDTTFAYLRSGF